MRAMRGSKFCFRHDPEKKDEIKQRWLEAVRSGSQRSYKTLPTLTMLRAMMEQYEKLKAWKSKTLLLECEKTSLLIRLQKEIQKLRFQLKLEIESKKAQNSSPAQD